ncbi:MAG: glycosyl hydrolase family 18 protein [Bacillota bacterium]
MVEIYGYYLSHKQTSQSSLNRFSGHLGRVLPTWLELKADGSLLVQSSESELALVKDLVPVNKVIPVLRNHGLDSRVSNKIITNPQSWQSILEQLLSYLEPYSFPGINFDLEGIDPDYSSELTNFLTLMARGLTDNGYKISLSLPARCADLTSGWSGAYNYRELGQLACEIIIMAYDYHWAAGPPGPIAPIDWVRDVIDYALIKIPSGKIILGIPCYGYDWSLDTDSRARGLSYNQVIQLTEKYRGELEYIEEFAAPCLTYTTEGSRHQVWFEDKQSLKVKFRLAADFQLPAVALWRLGLEDEQIWR